MLAPLSITGRLALIVVLALPATAFADSIDMLLAKEAPKIVKRLAKGGFETVAVMPFRVRNPETGVAIKGAMIQTNFAAKLERALAAAYDREQPVQIVFDAWDQIQQENPGASILTADGRKSIFQHTFDLPVAAPPTKIDAFLTGIIQPSADYRTTTVSFELCAADRPGQLMRSKPASVISTDRHALVSLGRGFSAPLQRYATRSLSNDDIMDCVAEDADWVRQKVATQSVASVEDRIQVPVTQPFENSPVLLRIYYDDQLQNLSLDTSGGQNNLTISDPKEGQVVTFEIENVSDAVMGVVLAINGVNTLYGGDATEPRSSAKWILQPKRKYGVRGIYSKDHKSVTPIRGVSDETSRAIVREGRMSLDLAGLIGFFVFRQAVTDDGTQQDGSLVTNQGEQATQAQTGERPSKADQDSLATKTSKSDSDDLVSLSDVTDINIQDDDTELTGFNLGLMRSLTFQPRENANRAGSWSKLRSKLLEPAKKSSTTRGLMIADGPRKQADLKTGSLGNNEMIVGAIIRYYSLAVPSRAR